MLRYLHKSQSIEKEGQSEASAVVGKEIAVNSLDTEKEMSGIYGSHGDLVIFFFFCLRQNYEVALFCPTLS